MAATLLNVPGLGWTDASGNPLVVQRVFRNRSETWVGTYDCVAETLAKVPHRAVQ